MRRIAALGGAMLGCLLVLASPALGAQSQAVTPPAALERPPSQTRPPPGHRLTAREVERLSGEFEKVRDELAKHPGYTKVAYTNGPGRWQVSYFSGRKEIAQVIVDERLGKVTAVWTGPQVAWQMARGLPGAFGRKVNAPYVWIPLMIAFFVPFFDWRQPLRLLHLDLLALLAFSISHIWFNRGEISTSVPLVYPVLGYLLVRMLIAGWRKPSGVGWAPPKTLVPARYLAFALIFLVGFRAGLNVTASNVIDVGYSGVIGADLIEHGKSPYGHFPSDDPSGDTYGPVDYYAYVPFELAFPWSGKWDDLPAAHAAALFFDLTTMLGLFLVGRRLVRDRGGLELGVVLAYAWAAYPYTVFVSSSNANDSLVAMLIVYSFLALSSPRGRGALLALASATKFAPTVLAPLYASYDRRRLRDALPFALAFAATVVAVTLPVLPGRGVSKLWDRTIGFQLGRDSPFSIWGQHPGLHWMQDVAKVFVAALALLVAFLPRRKNALQVAALGAAVLIALQITFSHWFYLYIVWWFPLAIIALLAHSREQAEPAI